MVPTVLYDACVLYPAPLWDLLMQLALTDVFKARWTDEIHDEWTRSVLSDRPDVAPESLARCRQLMDEHISDCLISGYELLIPTVTLPDPDDRHVLAAAIHGGADLIITFNLNDFPAPTLDQFHMRAVHPDEFIARLWDDYPAAVLRAARLHRASLQRPPKTVAEYVRTLEKCGLTETVARLRLHEDEF